MSHPEIVDPPNPEPAPDATVRLSVGEPANPYSTQQLDLSKQLAADSTQKVDRSVNLKADSTLKLPLGAPVPATEQTQKLVIPRFDEPPIRRQKVDLPAEAEGQTQPVLLYPETRKPFGWKLPAALGLLVVMGVVAYLLFFKQAPARPLPVAAVATVETVPPSVQIYLDQAKAGDTHAMRMLGAMYLQGLNVPKDREKGLYWYRMAAEKGSDAARSELNQIEGGR